MRDYLGQQFGVRNAINLVAVREFAQQMIALDAGIHGVMDPQGSRFITKMKERVRDGQRALTARGDLIVPCGKRTEDGRLLVDVYAGDAQQPLDRVPFSEGLVATGVGSGQVGLQRLRIIESRYYADAQLSPADRHRIEQVLEADDLEALSNEADFLERALDYKVAAVTFLGSWTNHIKRLQEVRNADQVIRLVNADVANVDELLDRGNNLMQLVGWKEDRQTEVREQPDLAVAARLASDIRSLLERADAIVQRNSQGTDR
ncbi:hypothetical protein DS843_13665 [Roseomonas genomospecies 6]|uniref:Uncharacterized protein n=2 Tax=Roseomonas genomospecies 6 TaxID=214106 RepID=A0A9W7NJA2_9PROT|nr:hypothetical protein DS843_13665 [Roseomonas genomospecies 6]